MFDTDLLADAAQFAVLGQRIAATVTTDTGGPVAAEALTEVKPAVDAVLAVPKVLETFSV
jgi:hypothetical protein